MTSEIRFYFKLFLRRIHWFLIIFTIFTAGSVTIARILPPTYTSATQLLLEPPQIPTQLAAPTVQTAAQEELQIVQQQLMTRTNLLDIARSEKVFADVNSMSADEVVRKMRDATNIVTTARQGQANLMNISFESNSGEVAAAVVNRYVTIILRDNAEFRTERAGKTLDFFQIEVERLGNELERLSSNLLDFNNKNSDALPTTLGFRLTQQGNLQAQISQAELSIQTLQDQRQRLLDVFQSTGSVTANAAPSMTPEQQKLATLETQLSNALALYSESNPKVRILRAQIAQQREVVRQEAGFNQLQGGQQADSILDVQLADIDGKIKALEEQKQIAEGALAKVVDTIERTPAVQIQLDKLNRDYNNIQQQYNTAVSGLAKAATGERIEVLAKGQRITVIDPATVPTKPSKPNRLLIVIGGVFMGGLFGIGLIAVLEFLNRSIRRPIEITRGLGITPLATVPYVRTPMELVARRVSYLTLFLALVIGVPAALYAVHTYYLPLDLIYDRIASRLGATL